MRSLGSLGSLGSRGSWGSFATLGSLGSQREEMQPIPMPPGSSIAQNLRISQLSPSARLAVEKNIVNSSGAIFKLFIVILVSLL